MVTCATITDMMPISTRLLCSVEVPTRINPVYFFEKLADSEERRSEIPNVHLAAIKSFAIVYKLKLRFAHVLKRLYGSCAMVHQTKLSHGFGFPRASRTPRRSEQY
jgi:hypothetical protein